MGIVLRFPGHARASAVAMPKRDGSTFSPVVSRALEISKKSSAGIRPRKRQLLTAERPTPQNVATFPVPPKQSKTSSTVRSMRRYCSRFVDSSSSHVLEIATDCEQWLNFSMISEKDFNLAVGLRVQILRKVLGLTQDDAGRTMGVGKSAVSNYENGSRALDPFSAFKLKLKYGATLEWLYAGDESTLAPALSSKIREAEQKVAKSA